MKVYILISLLLLSFSLATLRIDAESTIGDNFSVIGISGLLEADPTHQFGLEFSQISLLNNSYYSIGIILEQSIGDFSSSIGTVGYINKSSGNKPFGINSEIAWKLNVINSFNVKLIWRTDIIFDTQELTLQSLGAKINF